MMANRSGAHDARGQDEHRLYINLWDLKRQLFFYGITVQYWNFDHMNFYVV